MTDPSDRQVVIALIAMIGTACVAITVLAFLWPNLGHVAQIAVLFLALAGIPLGRRSVQASHRTRGRRVLPVLLIVVAALGPALASAGKTLTALLSAGAVGFLTAAAWFLWRRRFGAAEIPAD
jgi:hypothetical protein